MGTKTKKGEQGESRSFFLSLLGLQHKRELRERQKTAEGPAMPAGGWRHPFPHQTPGCSHPDRTTVTWLPFAASMSQLRSTQRREANLGLAFSSSSCSTKSPRRTTQACVARHSLGYSDCRDLSGEIPPTAPDPKRAADVVAAQGENCFAQDLLVQEQF